MLILGAGLAGCIAASMNQNARVYEASGNKTTHRALLRFRTPDIGEATGIPFKKVKVYKGIWHNGKPVELSPRYINLYSRKVADKINYRSICHQEAVDRYVAPDDFHAILRDQLGNRIDYDMDIKDVIMRTSDEPIISTIPMSVLAGMIDIPSPEFNGRKPKPIMVSRYHIPDCDVFMTYYFTDPTIGVYRASIDGGTLIIESMWEITDDDYKEVKRAFGLTGMILKPIVENFQQHNGKMTPIDERSRRDFIVNATITHGIYSLGRFATWRNLVLDDVYHDLVVIKQLINKDLYGQHLIS